MHNERIVAKCKSYDFSISVPANTSETTHQEEVKEHSLILESERSSPQTGCEEEDGDTCEEGQEVEEEEEEQCEETPEEEEVKVEWPTGVPQASDKDLAKLSHKEGVGLHFSCLYTRVSPTRGYEMTTNEYVVMSDIKLILYCTKFLSCSLFLDIL